MATTKNIQSSLLFCRPYINFQPLTIGGLEPALTAANLILKTILGPPFVWRWNRTSVQIAASGAQDYVRNLPDFGFLERGWVLDGTDTKELQIRSGLGATGESSRPEFAAAQYDDNAGNVTFRTMPKAPNGMTVTLEYQKKPVLMTSMASLWSPIPDEYDYIHNWGMLSMGALLSNDARFSFFNQKFVSSLLGAQEALDEMQRNIFLGNWLEITRMVERSDLKTKQGIASRQF